MSHLLCISNLFNYILLFLLLNWIKSLLCLIVQHEYLLDLLYPIGCGFNRLGPSAFDISREVATVAKEVHITTRAPNVTVGKSDNHENIWLHKMVAFLLYFFFFRISNYFSYLFTNMRVFGKT